jgi:hypothetical protein
VDMVAPKPSRFWICREYGKPLVYSKYETDLETFLRKEGLL